MEFFLYVAFAGSLACFALGLYILLPNRSSTMHRLFAAICFILSILNMDSLPAYTADTRESIFFYTQIASCAVNFFYAVNLHFYLFLLTKKHVKLPVLCAVYFPALLIIVIYSFNPLLILDYYRYGDQWKLIPKYDSLWFYLASGRVVWYTVATVAVISYFGLRSHSNKERLQAKWLVVNLTLSTLVGIVGMWVIPFFKPDVANVGPTYHLPYVAGLYFAVFRFRMMEMRPEIVANEIISHIGDMVFLLDPEMRIISANERCREVIGLDTGHAAGMRFMDLVADGGGPAPECACASGGRGEKVKQRITYRGAGEPVETDSYLSKVTDRFGDIAGHLVISRENRGRRQFARAYRLTDREMEIVDLTLEGLSSKQIGERLRISERTVQSHQEHVYQKLGAEGKVDLIHAALAFNMIARN